MSSHECKFRTLSLPDVETLISRAKELGLEGTEVFEKYTLEQIAAIYNGIGPDRFPEWFRYILSEINEIILPSAIIHDLDYDFGGSLKDFYAANERLGRNANVCILEKYKEPSLKRWFYLVKIRIFVKLCNKYGKPGWNFKGETC